ncbi:hypothetical protein [Streptomyces sp. NPDC058486]|uniref:hypothetical protein n=1 Tax=unclassified Streptomyces TaxID=2593676 RepID=UPI00364F7D36
MTAIAVPKPGVLLTSLRSDSRAVVRVTGRGEGGGLAVVDAVTLGRPRTIRLSALRPYEVLYRGRPPRSGYVPRTEADFVRRLLDGAICTAFGTDDPDAVNFVRAHPDWASGGIARLAHEDEQTVGVCVKALTRAGYAARPAPEHVAGFGSALRFRRLASGHLCPALEQAPRSLDGWEPWSCDLDPGHTGSHHHLAANYRWTDDTSPALCGAWADAGPGRTLGACALPAGHPPTQRHRVTPGG